MTDAAFMLELQILDETFYDSHENGTIR